MRPWNICNSYLRFVHGQHYGDDGDMLMLMARMRNRLAGEGAENTFRTAYGKCQSVSATFTLPSTILTARMENAVKYQPCMTTTKVRGDRVSVAGL